MLRVQNQGLLDKWHVVVSTLCDIQSIVKKKVSLQSFNSHPSSILFLTDQVLFVL